MNNLMPLILLMALAPWAAGEDEIKVGPWCQASPATLQLLEDAIRHPPADLRQVIPSGGALKLGEVLGRKGGEWWNVLNEKGQFEIYRYGVNRRLSGPVPEGFGWTFPERGFVYTLTSCELRMQKDGQLWLFWTEDQDGGEVKGKKFIYDTGVPGCSFHMATPWPHFVSPKGENIRFENGQAIKK